MTEWASFDADLDLLLDQTVAAATGSVSMALRDDELTVPLCVACPEIVEVLNAVRGPYEFPEPSGATDPEFRRAIEVIEDGGSQ